MTHNLIVHKLISKLKSEIDLSKTTLSIGYYYAHLPLAVIDSVFSIGVRYEQVTNAVHHFAQRSKWQVYRPKGSGYPPADQQRTISDLCAAFPAFPKGAMPVEVAVDLFGNRGRSNPASRTPILKAELVYKVACVLRANHIERFEDFTSFPEPAALENELNSLPSMSSGVLVRYLKMLCGAESEIKPDRHILAFIREAAGDEYLPLTSATAVRIVQDAANILSKEDGLHHLNPRLLDHAIWSFHRASTSRYTRDNVTPNETEDVLVVDDTANTPTHTDSSQSLSAQMPEHLDFESFWAFCTKGGVTPNGLIYSVDELDRLHILSRKAKPENQKYKISKRKVAEYLTKAHEVQFRRNHGWFSKVYDYAIQRRV